MDANEAITIFDTLSQETRLNAFRILVKAGPGGLSAGKISEKLSIPQNTLSFHLNHLSNAGILTSRRDGRSIIYSANFDAIHQLIRFMVKDCCSENFAQIKDGQGQNQHCAIIELSKCC